MPNQDLLLAVRTYPHIGTNSRNYWDTLVSKSLDERRPVVQDASLRQGVGAVDVHKDAPERLATLATTTALATGLVSEEARRQQDLVRYEGVPTIEAPRDVFGRQVLNGAVFAFPASDARAPHRSALVEGHWKHAGRIGKSGENDDADRVDGRDSRSLVLALPSGAFEVARETTVLQGGNGLGLNVLDVALVCETNDPKDLVEGARRSVFLEIVPVVPDVSTWMMQRGDTLIGSSRSLRLREQNPKEMREIARRVGHLHHGTTVKHLVRVRARGCEHIRKYARLGGQETTVNAESDTLRGEDQVSVFKPKFFVVPEVAKRLRFTLGTRRLGFLCGPRIVGESSAFEGGCLPTRTWLCVGRKSGSSSVHVYNVWVIIRDIP